MKKAHADIHLSLEEAKANGAGLTSYLPTMPAIPTLGVNRLWGEGQAQASTATAPNGASSPSETPSAGAAAPVAAEDEAPAYTPPSPRLFFAHFVDHRDLFVHFLEDVAYALWGQRVDPSTKPGRIAQKRELEDTVVLPKAEADQRAVWNTLLELYLDSTRSANAKDVIAAARGKVLGLLASSSIPYDPMHALVLCSMAEFTDGLVGLWESLGMYEDVLRYWMERDSAAAEGRDSDSEAEGANAADEIMRYLNLYGPGNPSLYPMVLRYITSSGAVLSRHKASLPRILETIDAERIIPPLAVVQLLSRNGVASVGTVKEWLRAKVEETRQEINAVSLRTRRRNKLTGRIRCWSRAIAEKRRPRRRTLLISPTSASPKYSRSRSAPRAAASSISQRCTSCANTRTTSAALATQSPSVSSAHSSTPWSASCGITRRVWLIGTTCSLARCMTPTTRSRSWRARSVVACSRRRRLGRTFSEKNSSRVYISSIAL